jgi:hypothetical protein
VLRHVPTKTSLPVGDSHHCPSGDWGRTPYHLRDRKNGQPQTSCGSSPESSTRQVPSYSAPHETASASSGRQIVAALDGYDRDHCEQGQV